LHIPSKSELEGSMHMHNNNNNNNKLV